MVKLILQNSTCEIVTDNKELLVDVSEQLTYINKSVDFAYAKTLGQVSRYNKMVARETNEAIVAKYKSMLRKLLFNIDQLEATRRVKLMKGKEFPAGLLPRVMDYLDGRKIYWELDDKRNSNVPKVNLKLLRPIPELRYYQKEAIEKALESERGVLEMATGSGKTLIISKLLSELKVKSLIITPSLDITQGVYDTMVSFFGEKQVSVLDGKKPKFAIVNIVNIQTLVKMDPKFFIDIHCMLTDEFHHSGSISFLDINFTHLKSCYFRYGLTATNFRNAGDGMALEGVLSNRLYHYPATKAIKDGFLTKPEFMWIYNKTKPNNNYQTEYKNGIVENKDRNHKIVEIAKSHPNDSVIILVQQVAHGNLLLADLPKARLLTGSENREDRQKMLDDFRSGKLKCLIGTSVLGEGVDLPIANVLVLAGGGKSKIQVMQNVGRVMRLFPGKTKALVYDFREEGSKYLASHATERAAIFVEVYGD